MYRTRSEVTTILLKFDFRYTIYYPDLALSALKRFILSSTDMDDLATLDWFVADVDTERLFVAAASALTRDSTEDVSSIAGLRERWSEGSPAVGESLFSSNLVPDRHLAVSLSRRRPIPSRFWQLARQISAAITLGFGMRSATTSRPSKT